MKHALIVAAVVAALWLVTGTSLAFAMEPTVAGTAQRIPAAGVRPPAGGLVLLAIVGIGAIGACGGLAGFLFATRATDCGASPSRAR